MTKRLALQLAQAVLQDDHDGMFFAEKLAGRLQVRLRKEVALKEIYIDRGTEFVSWPHLQAEIGTQIWFCDPSSPWQKGTVENTNRRARRWLPKKRDITAVSDHELKMICDRLNATPRKCLGWKTPAEMFREKMIEEMGRSPYPQKE